MVCSKLRISENWRSSIQFQLQSEEFIAANEIQGKMAHMENIVRQNNFNDVTGDGLHLVHDSTGTCVCGVHHNDRRTGGGP